jgi:hypothetical protein
MLVHRHFAPHTSPTGTHVDRAGVAEGAPEWLDDSCGALRERLVTAGPTTAALQTIDPQAVNGAFVAPLFEPFVPYPPGPLSSLRGPPRMKRRAHLRTVKP